MQHKNYVQFLALHQKLRSNFIVAKRRDNSLFQIRARKIVMFVLLMIIRHCYIKILKSKLKQRTWLNPEITPKNNINSNYIHWTYRKYWQMHYQNRSYENRCSMREGKPFRYKKAVTCAHFEKDSKSVNNITRIQKLNKHWEILSLIISNIYSTYIMIY